jgi:hypothetical protein
MTPEEKIYSIGLKGSSHSYALTHLHADQFHGVHCLKGIARSAKGESWAEGKRIYIPVAEIAAITEYDSWNDFLAARKLSNGAGEKKPTPPPATKMKKLAKPKKR